MMAIHACFVIFIIYLCQYSNGKILLILIIMTGGTVLSFYSHTDFKY